MSRAIREQEIGELIVEHVVSSQRQLVELLAARAITATQATVSRDIKRLGLVKRPARDGGYRYAAPSSSPGPRPDGRRELRSACEQYLTKIESGDAILVLKTLTGRANALAVALDECRIDEIVGTLAGDDTILIVTRRDDRAKLRGMLEEIVSG